MTDSHGGYDDEIDLTPPSVGAQYHPAETEDLLLSLRELLVNARDLPLSASSVIVKEDALGYLDGALDALPEELRAARWLLKEREEFIARTRREAADILEQARDRAERMVERAEVVKAAEARAAEILDLAEADGRRLRHEVEDFCDQKLASFEIVLERTQKLVAAGRAKLQGTNLLAEAAAAAEHGFEGPPDDRPDGPRGGSGRDMVHDAPIYSDDRMRPSVQPALYDVDSATNWDDGVDDGADDATDDWDDDWSEEPEPVRPRLTVVDDRYADVGTHRADDRSSDRWSDPVDDTHVGTLDDRPAPSSGHPTRPSTAGRGATSNFFDQDLA